MKRIFNRFEANKLCIIRVFRIKANQRILHAKRIKTEANIPFKANILKRNEVNIFKKIEY